ncbi:hypothetical protein GOV07_04230 [Candidatus Woesearchaeota archaeon]|nr:hypothetical protein [Candidatus Woesearchaeota archaeon]
MANEYYDLSVEEIIAKIKSEKVKRVLIQLPDGLKPEAKTIQNAVAKELPEIELCFWGGSAYGACDIPLGVDKLGFDLLIHLGHATWR